MFLLRWYEEWCRIRFNNKSIEQEFEHRGHKEEREVKICDSCETLRHQLEIANFEKKQLLDRLITTPPPTVERTTAPEPQAVKPRAIPWRVRQQMLESEDRAKAKAMREAAQEDQKPIVDVADMERELDIAAKERESASNQ